MLSAVSLAILGFVGTATVIWILFTFAEVRARKVRLLMVLATGALPETRSQKRKKASLLNGFLLRAIRNINERVSIMSGGEAQASADRLRLAGYRSRDALIIYSFLKLVLPFLGLAIGYLAARIFGTADDSSLKALIYTVSGGLVASKAPDAILNKISERRITAVRRAFPDMLELLVVTTEAGLSMTPAMLRVSQELTKIGGALSVELSTLAVELGMYSDRQRAWSNFEASLPIPEISVFVNTMQQAERYGTPTAEALRALMRDQRAMRLLSVEEKAARIPVLMTIPLIAFIMPSLFVVLIGPAALNIIDNIING